MSIAEQLLANDPASQILGIKLVDIDEESCTVSMSVRQDMVNGYGVCHGGFIFTLGDTASAFASAMEGESILSVSNHIDYLASGQLGDELTAAAKVKYISGRNLICDVTITNQDNKLVAVMRSKLIGRNNHGN